MKLYLVVALVLVGACALVTGQMGMGGASGSGMMNPMAMMVMMQMMGDPNMKHMPIMSILMRNPAMMMNPMGAYVIAKILGVDLHKIATPFAMANGSGGGGTSFLRWLPLIMGDPNMMSLMYSFGGFGGATGGMGSGMNMGSGMAPMY